MRKEGTLYMSNFKSFMEKFKKNIFIFLIVWIIIAILLIAPLTYIKTESILAGQPFISAVVTQYLDVLLKFPITVIFEEKYVGDFIKGFEIYSIIYWIFIIYSIYKTLPKSRYDKIEHGSSDWCMPGEQYKILSKKSGLILAKDNYLPIDKPGNVNVLIVGRIWCW